MPYSLWYFDSLRKLIQLLKFFDLVYLKILNNISHLKKKQNPGHSSCDSNISL